MEHQDIQLDTTPKQPRIIFICDVLHYAPTNHTERMQLVITKNDLLIQKKDILMRQVELIDIEALTTSVTSSEVVIHCYNEEDERLDFGLKKQLFIKVMVYIRTKTIYNGGTGLSLLRVYTVEDEALGLYVTTADDIDERRKVRPEDRLGPEIDYFAVVREKDEKNKNKRDHSVYNKNSKTNDLSKLSITNFELLRVLGKGAHGKVLLVQEKSTGALLAVKILRKQHIVEHNQVDHTISEKNILTTIRHPFIVSLERCFHTSDKVYFTMEFMKGGELFQHLRKIRQFTEKQTKFIAGCLILALGHLHDHDLIYRDLKPENILLDEQGYCKLTDFGFSKSVTVNDTARTFCGTPEYMPPEVILGRGCNRQGDWWSLGVLVYEMIYGIPPFYSTNTQKMYKSTLVDSLKFKKHTNCSKEVQDFIAGLLVKDQRKRLGSVADVNEVMAHPWFNGFDWQSLEKKTLVMPYRPGDYEKDWEMNFEPEFMKLKPRDSVCVTNRDVIEPFEHMFDGFDYVNEDFEREADTVRKNVTGKGVKAYKSIECLDCCDEDDMGLEYRTEALMRCLKGPNDDHRVHKGDCTSADGLISSDIGIKR